MLRPIIESLPAVPVQVGIKVVPVQDENHGIGKMDRQRRPLPRVQAGGESGVSP